MELIIKTYDELSKDELYDILRARAEVFVVEQKCLYNDLDGTDRLSLHVFLRDGDSIVAYLRIIPKGICDESVHIGRVITLRRGEGLGAKIMEAALRVAKERLLADSVVISAQTHAIGFYEKSGFTTVSDVYMEVDIPHVRMIRKL